MAEEKVKYFHETARCPSCLRVGEMKHQYGCCICDHCDKRWRDDTIGHWMKAFDQGREFERKLLLTPRPKSPD